MTDNIKPTVQEKSAWAKVPQEFNDWWNGDYSDESNPFRLNSAAYWAWAGWSEAVRLNAQATSMQWPKPEDVTPEMLNAFRSAYKEGDFWRARIHGALCAMLSAAPQPAQHWVKAPEVWPIAPDVSADLERSDWTPEDALRWYATGKHYDTVPNGDGTSSARILDNGAVASNALKSLSREYAEHKGDVALQELAPQPAQQPLTDQKDALLRQALEALEGFANITNDSQGVAGYHLSGDTAEWGEFPEVYHADKAIEAIRNHLGVKND